jgi:protein-disulfide isomerase
MQKLTALAVLAAASFAAPALRAATAPATTPAPAKTAVAAASTTLSEAQKAQIIANLKLKFPDLATLNPTITDVTTIDGVQGMYLGTLTLTTPQGPNGTKFLVTADVKTLYPLRFPEPVDVSKDEAAVKAEAAKLAEEQKIAEAKKLAEAAEMAKTVQPDLEAAAKGLPVRGNPDAKVTVYAFSDFQCPYCSRGFQTVEALLKKYPKEIKFVFFNYPLSFHPWAKPAAIAGYCAAQQNPEMFWVLHDKFFGNQSAVNPENVVAKAKEYLEGEMVENPKTKQKEFPKGKSFDMGRWSTCAAKSDSAEYKAASQAVDAQEALGAKHGINGTPGFFVNGQRVEGGAVPPEAFDPIIAAALQPVP